MMCCGQQDVGTRTVNRLMDEVWKVSHNQWLLVRGSMLDVIRNFRITFHTVIHNRIHELAPTLPTAVMIQQQLVFK